MGYPALTKSKANDPQTRIQCYRTQGLKGFCWHLSRPSPVWGYKNDFMSSFTHGRNVDGGVHYDLLTWNSRPGRKGKGCVPSYYPHIESPRTVSLNRMLMEVETPYLPPPHTHNLITLWKMWLYRQDHTRLQ